MSLKLTGRGNWLVWVLLTGVFYVFTVLMVGIGWGLFSHFFSGLVSPAFPTIFLVGFFCLPITFIFRKFLLACLRFFIQWLPGTFFGQKLLPTTIHYTRMESQIKDTPESSSPDKKIFLSTKIRLNYPPDEPSFFAQEEKPVWTKLLNNPELEEKELLSQAKLFLSKKKKSKDNPPN
jgi:hypothetical protein